MEISELKERIDALNEDIGKLYAVKRQLEQEYWEKINKEYGGPITAYSTDSPKEYFNETKREFNFNVWE